MQEGAAFVVMNILDRGLLDVTRLHRVALPTRIIAQPRFLFLRQVLLAVWCRQDGIDHFIDAFKPECFGHNIGVQSLITREIALMDAVAALGQDRDDVIAKVIDQPVL